MTLEITCPVCDFRHVSPDAESCPQCDADLTCYQLIDALPDELVLDDDVPNARGKDRVFTKPVLLIGIVGATLCLLCVGLLLFFAFFRQFQSQLETQQTRIRNIEAALLEPEHASVATASSPQPAAPKSTQKAASTGVPKNLPAASSPPLAKDQPPNDIENLKAASTGAPKNLPAAKRPSVANEPASDFQVDESDFFVYYMQSSDRLWSVAKKFYRDGDMYPLLLLQNSHLKIYGTKAGTAVKILKSRKKARAIFNRIAERKHGDIYYWYPLSEADTLSSLTVRFYGPHASPKRITTLNPDVAIESGNRIRIVAE